MLEEVCENGAELDICLIKMTVEWQLIKWWKKA